MVARWYSSGLLQHHHRGHIRSPCDQRSAERLYFSHLRSRCRDRLECGSSHSRWLAEGTPSYTGNSSSIGYLTKSGESTGVDYTTNNVSRRYVDDTMRSPAYSPDGSKIVYEIYEWEQRPAGKELSNWDSEWEYRFMDVFPQLNQATNRLANTQKQLGNASPSAVATNPDYSNLVTAFDVFDVEDSSVGASSYASGLAGAFRFFSRTTAPATLYMFDANGTISLYQNLTDGILHIGFPSLSPDGSKLVYRLRNQTLGPIGLQVLDLGTGRSMPITWGWDNTPGWSPDGEPIVFTRQTKWTQEYGSRCNVPKADFKI